MYSWDGEGCFGSRWPRASIDEFSLECAKEALDHRVVPPVAATTHAALDAVRLESTLVVAARVMCGNDEGAKARNLECSETAHACSLRRSRSEKRCASDRALELNAWPSPPR